MALFQYWFVVLTVLFYSNKSGEESENSMKKYVVKIMAFTPRKIIDLFDKVKYRCRDLVGEKIHLRSLNRDITIEEWRTQESLTGNSIDLIMVFTCNKEMKDPEEVLLEVLKFNKAREKVKE